MYKNEEIFDYKSSKITRMLRETNDGAGRYDRLYETALSGMGRQDVHLAGDLVMVVRGEQQLDVFSRMVRNVREPTFVSPQEESFFSIPVALPGIRVAHGEETVPVMVAKMRFGVIDNQPSLIVSDDTDPKVVVGLDARDQKIGELQRMGKLMYDHNLQIERLEGGCELLDLIYGEMVAMFTSIPRVVIAQSLLEKGIYARCLSPDYIDGIGQGF